MLYTVQLFTSHLSPFCRLPVFCLSDCLAAVVRPHACQPVQTYAMVQKGSEGQVTGDDSLKVQSSEGQQLNLDVVIQYQVKKFVPLPN